MAAKCECECAGVQVHTHSGVVRRSRGLHFDDGAASRDEPGCRRFRTPLHAGATFCRRCSQFLPRLAILLIIRFWCLKLDHTEL